VQSKFAWLAPLLSNITVEALGAGIMAGRISTRLACMFAARASKHPALARNNNTGKGQDLLGLYRARGSSPTETRKFDWSGYFVGFAAEQICALARS
jgi:hypothetical protein